MCKNTLGTFYRVYIKNLFETTQEINNIDSNNLSERSIESILLVLKFPGTIDS